MASLQQFNRGSQLVKSKMQARQNKDTKGTKTGKDLTHAVGYYRESLIEASIKLLKR